MNRFFIKKYFLFGLACQFIMLFSHAQGFTILYPKNGAELPFNRDVPGQYFTFMWSDTNLMYAPYHIKIAEITGTQTPQEALDQNPPVFVRDSLAIFYFNYPWNAPVLGNKKKYAFSVTGILNSDTVITIIDFIINNELSPQEGFVQRSVNQYAMLQESLDGTIHAGYDKHLWVKYKENYEVGASQKLRYVIYDEQHRIIVKTNEAGALNPEVVNTLPIRYGENYLIIKFDIFPAIKPRQTYFLEVWNEKGQFQYLRFMCDYSIAIGALRSDNFFNTQQ